MHPPLSTRIIVLISIAVCLQGAFGQNGACNEANRVSNLNGCLAEIRSVAANSSYFWFGSIYMATCTDPYSMNCLNPNVASGPQSLFKLSFGLDSFDGSTIDRFVEVNYTSASGSYTGCDSTFTQNDTMQFSIDPTSSTAYTPWQLRALPEVSYTTSSRFNELYTLIIMDPGFGFLHAFYTNIPGTNVSQGTVIQAYSGPRNFREVQNAYAFLVYKQQAVVNMTSGDLGSSLVRFNATQYADTYQLGDLVGFTFMRTSYDAYALELAAAAGIGQNCADLVSKAYATHTTRSFLPSSPTLSVYLRLRYSHDAFNFSCGYDTRSQAAADFYVNPIDRPIVNTADTRVESTKTYSVLMNKVGPSNPADFTGKMYSLVMVDADIPASYAILGTADLPYLHGLTTNIQGDNFTTGTETKTYRGPAPPDSQPHVYYFLLYEQNSTLQLTNTSDYTSSLGMCSTIDTLVGRCLFNVTTFVSANNLTLVGATWLTATTDDYVTCANIVTTPGGGSGAAPVPVAGLLVFVLSLLLTISTVV